MHMSDLMSFTTKSYLLLFLALKKGDNDYNSMKVTTDTVFEISTGSLATATMTTEAPTIGSTKSTTTNFEEKYPSFNLIGTFL